MRGHRWRAGSEVAARARELRRSETDAEEVLWASLRDRKLGGMKFRRQHPFDMFILDFFCPEKGLCVEVDGSIHGEKDQKARDAERDAVLRARGLNVLRFRSEEIEADLPAVLAEITREAGVGPHPPAPSPASAGEGEPVSHPGERVSISDPGAPSAQRVGEGVPVDGAVAPSPALAGEGRAQRWVRARLDHTASPFHSPEDHVSHPSDPERHGRRT
ncbi:MAG: endonuclease domain-containing protein [Thermoanaerobaculia bacterium]|nr:endonuclease domain-containing protein [Thermoanaerobaculia bacterium]